MKTEDDFIEEVTNVKLKNLNLMDQLEKKQYKRIINGKKNIKKQNDYMRKRTESYEKGI